MGLNVATSSTFGEAPKPSSTVEGGEVKKVINLGKFGNAKPKPTETPNDGTKSVEKVPTAEPAKVVGEVTIQDEPVLGKHERPTDDIPEADDATQHQNKRMKLD